MRLICDREGILVGDYRGNEYRVVLTLLSPNNWTCTLDGFFTVDGISIIGDGDSDLAAMSMMLEWAEEAEQDWMAAETHH